MEGDLEVTKPIIILLFWGILFAQEAHKELQGTVTYITVENVYCDLGSEHGLSSGDTLRVFRRNDEIGLLVVQSAGRKSSVTNPLTGSNLIQLGDRIIFTQKAKKEVVEVVEELPVVVKKIQEKKVIKIKSFSQGGSVSIRGNWNQYNQTKSYQRFIGNVNYRMSLVSPFKSQLWVYGHDNFTDHSFRMYQMRLELGDLDSRIYSQVGRLYSSELVGVGAVDGLLISVGKNRKIRLGAMVGFQPDNLKTALNTDIKKVSIFSTNEWRNNKQRFKINAALVGQYAGKGIDREFMYFKLLWRTGPNLELSWYETVDLYRDSTMYNRSSVEPLSTQISVRYRIGKVTFNSRFSSRKQILYRQSGSMLPDSLFMDEQRVGWYNSFQFRRGNGATFRLSGNVRTQINSTELSMMITAGYTAPRLSKDIYLRFSSSFLKNLLISGFRNRLSASKSLNKNGSVFVDYDLYIYGYGNRLANYARNTVTLGFNYRLIKKLNTNLSVDLSKDGSFTSTYIYTGLSYRF